MDRVNVYVLADGVMPSTSITMSLFFPLWKYTSIDPILDFDTSSLGSFSSRIQCVKALSQDFVISLESIGIHSESTVATGQKHSISSLLRSSADCASQNYPNPNPNPNSHPDPNPNRCVFDFVQWETLLMEDRMVNNQTASCSIREILLMGDKVVDNQASSSGSSRSSSSSIDQLKGSQVSPSLESYNIVIACHSHAPLQVTPDPNS
jgi:hypothetical protein